jgi:hypothetical protein
MMLYESSGSFANMELRVADGFSKKRRIYWRAMDMFYYCCMLRMDLS